MTLENSKRLIEHYKALIENPDLAMPYAVVKNQGAREVIIKGAKEKLADMEENLKIREFIVNNPDKKLNPATVLKKLKIPSEALEKDVVDTPEPKSKKKAKA
jgi:hypothetical protein|tara:strand:+ start:969 stop:1274 length:306 start_codon:yes stop_codon:yes gene_type:complete